MHDKTDHYFNKEELEYYQQMIEKETNYKDDPPINSFKKGNLLGEGSYGRVYQAFEQDFGRIIAVKEINLRRIGSYSNNYIDSRISSFESEIEILSKLNHKNIVKYYGTKRTNDAFQIFLEYCSGGSIASMLEIYKSFHENVIKKYTKQILEGLEYLHAHNVIHRGNNKVVICLDIKGANILVDRDGLCKLSDFGGAKVIVDEIEFKQQNSFKGTPNWMAPETVKSMEYTRFSDIWSLGCTVIEMSTGEPPWSEYKNPMAALYNLMQTNSPPNLPEHLSETCKDFLQCCLKIEPKERWNVKRLLNHPFITEGTFELKKENSNVSTSDFRKKAFERSRKDKFFDNNLNCPSKEMSFKEGHIITKNHPNENLNDGDDDNTRNINPETINLEYGDSNNNISDTMRNSRTKSITRALKRIKSSEKDIKLKEHQNGNVDDKL